MDRYQRKALSWTAVVFAAAALVAGIVLRSGLAGVGMFVLLHAVAWSCGWPPPGASNGQSHMLHNPGRGS